MKSSTIIGASVALIIGVGAWYWFSSGALSKPQDSLGSPPTFLIEGEPVTLIDGRAETPAAPGSATTVVTQYFGNPAVGDLNGDGALDTAFIITQSRGGSGTFYYAVAVLVSDEGYQGTSAILLGDRVAPQTTEIRDGTLIVNYAERAPGEAMSAPPSVGKSLVLMLDPATMQLSSVSTN